MCRTNKGRPHIHRHRFDRISLMGLSVSSKQLAAASLRSGTRSSTRERSMSVRMLT
jgi:hypothetical protein